MPSPARNPREPEVLLRNTASQAYRCQKRGEADRRPRGLVYPLLLEILAGGQALRRDPVGAAEELPGGGCLYRNRFRTPWLRTGLADGPLFLFTSLLLSSFQLRRTRRRPRESAGGGGGENTFFHSHLSSNTFPLKNRKCTADKVRKQGHSLALFFCPAGRMYPGQGDVNMPDGTRGGGENTFFHSHLSSNTFPLLGFKYSKFVHFRQLKNEAKRIFRRFAAQRQAELVTIQWCGVPGLPGGTA